MIARTTPRSIFDLGPVTSPYGDTDGRSSAHNGIDIGAQVGTPIPLPVGGQVERTLYDRQGGTQVIVRTPGGFEQVFAHLSAIAVSIGDVIDAGSVIGYSGASGTVTGPHLHYEVRPPGGGTLDPLAFLQEFAPGYAPASPIDGAAPSSTSTGTVSADPMKCAVVFTFTEGAAMTILGLDREGLRALAYACGGAAGQKSGPEALASAVGSFLFDSRNWARLGFTLVGGALVAAGIAIYIGALRPETVVRAAKGEASA